jgi:transposase
LIVLNLGSGARPAVIAKFLGVSRATIYRVAGRFREFDEAGLIDRREENGERKLDGDYLAQLHEIVASSAQEHGWPRPTWTLELLIKTMERHTGVRVSCGTMSLALKILGARRGNPKPTVRCPWPEARRNRRLREIERLVESAGEDEVVVYEDEVDIHLNPKIGLDWMVRGQQKEVVTPGKNVKRYLAGAFDPVRGDLIWVEGEQKRSHLFIELLWQLHLHYPDAKKIHVILDNYSIHSTEQVQKSLETEAGGRIQLHFLPPYCPDHNRIERIWQDLHANVTRNHTCQQMPELMKNVRRYLKARNKQLQAQYQLAA